MNSLDKNKNNIRSMFFVSVKNDIKSWSFSENYENMYSPLYSEYRLNIDLYNKSLYLYYNKSEYIKILTYKIGFFPVDFKVYMYIKKLIKNLKKLEEDKKNENDINILKNGLEKIQEKYIKSVRKEKLDYIVKNF